MSGRQNKKYGNKDSEDQIQHHQKIPAALCYREKPYSYYKNCKTEEIRNWPENGVGMNDISHHY